MASSRHMQRRIEQDVEAQAKRAAEERERQKQAQLNYALYSIVADRLAELGIDPYELRDYLAGLPARAP